MTTTTVELPPRPVFRVRSWNCQTGQTVTEGEFEYLPHACGLAAICSTVPDTVVSVVDLNEFTMVSFAEGTRCFLASDHPNWWVW
jgi:hypothetical protein